MLMESEIGLDASGAKQAKFKPSQLAALPVSQSPGEFVDDWWRTRNTRNDTLPHWAISDALVLLRQCRAQVQNTCTPGDIRSSSPSSLVLAHTRPQQIETCSVQLSRVRNRVLQKSGGLTAASRQRQLTSAAVSGRPQIVLESPTCVRGDVDGAHSLTRGRQF